MHILVLASTEGLYGTAMQLAYMGCNVSYYDQRGKGLAVVDDKEVVHVSSWRPHVETADLVITNDVALYYAYERAGGKAPILYHANFYTAQILIPPTARDLLVCTLTGVYAPEQPRPWWKFWSSNA